jgi:hypothetical protein
LEKKMKLFKKLLPWFMPTFQTMAVTAAGIGVAGAAITAGTSIANSSSAKGANNKALKAQMEQNWRNQQLAQQMRDENFNQYNTAQRDAQGYIQGAGQYAQGLQGRYINQGGAAMDALSNKLGIGGIGSQAEADSQNAANEADYQKKLAAYNSAGQVDNSGYQKQLADYQAQQKKVQDVKNWYNTFGASHGVSIAQAMQMGGIDQSMMDAKAPVQAAAADRGAAPVRADKVTYDANSTAGQNYGELNKTYGLADYKNDPTYTPLVSNTLNDAEYKNSQGYTPLVSNTFNQDEYSKDVGYTPMVNSLEDLQNTPGYKFQLEQGLQSLGSSAAAKGMTLSGAALKSANNYAQGQAATGFQNAWQRGQDAYQNAYARKQERYQQGQDAYSNAFNRKMTQYGQGQTAYNNARGNFQDQQQQKFERLYNVAGMGQNAANNAGQMAMNTGSQSADNSRWGATGRVNANTDAYNMYTGSGQNYANNQGDVYRGNSMANQNMNSNIGNSLVNLGGQYLTYRNGQSTNNGTGTGLNGASNNNGTGQFNWNNGSYNNLSKGY